MRRVRLTVKSLDAGDTWKDIVRIKNKYRTDHKDKHIRRGTICRVAVGDKSTWVIVHGREPDDSVIQMDLNTRLALGLKKEETRDFTIFRLSWIRSLWFPWKASDPMYRLPAQLSLVSFFLGMVLGVLGILVGIIPMYRDHHDRAPTHQSAQSSASSTPIKQVPGTK
jgi:hypothetical protein